MMNGEQPASQATAPAPTAGQAPAPGKPTARGWVARLGGASWSGRIGWAAAAVVLVVIVVVSLTGGGAGAQRSALPPAKNFALKELGHPGQMIGLAAFAGRPLIVNFFASWCPPCKRETPLLASFYKDARGSVAIIGVDANDEAGPAEQFLRRAGVTYPIGFDPLPASITTSYGVYGLPQTFFLDSKHRIVKHAFGALTRSELHAGVALMDRKNRG